MGFFRDLYQYVIREGWLIITGRHAQAMDEADVQARTDLEVEYEKARGRPQYQRYFAEMETWKDSFDELVSKMEAEGAHRKAVYTEEDFRELPTVPDLDLPIGFSYDHTVAYKLYVKTQEWRAERIEKLRSRVGSQR